MLKIVNRLRSPPLSGDRVPPASPQQAAGWMLLASALFASMGACVKLSAGPFSTGEQVLARGVIGSLGMLLIVRLRLQLLATPHWRLQLGRALTGSAALCCYFYAIAHAPLATAVTLGYTSPLFVAILLSLFWRERPAPQAWLAVVLGLAGVSVLLRPTLQADAWAGTLAGLASGAMASLAYLSVRELGRLGEPEVRTVFWFSMLTAGCGALLWALAPPPDGTPPATADQWLALAGVGLFGSAAQLAMTRSYRCGHTLVSAALSYTTVAFAALYGFALWQEHPGLPGLAAMGLIALSGLLATRSGRRGQAD